MILYHGSNVLVDKPQIIATARRLDFGVGFYLTSNYEQAERWAVLTAKRKGEGKAQVISYEFNEAELDNFKILFFKEANVEWLKYASHNRKDPQASDDYDVVIGPVANDRTMPVISACFAGIYDEEETIRRLMPQKLQNQYVFKTELSLSLLSFKETKLL